MGHQHGFREKTWYYQWNTLNQLIAYFNPEGECWRYTYDAFGRRLSKHKVVDNRPTPPLNSPFKDKRIQRVDYLWSGNQIVQETPIIHAIELASKTDMGTKLPLLTSRNHEVISKLPTK